MQFIKVFLQRVAKTANFQLECLKGFLARVVPAP